MNALFKVGGPSGVKGLLAGLVVASLMLTRVSAALPVLTAAPITLAWDPSPSTSVAGYKVCYGLVNSAITSRMDTGRTLSATLSGLTAGANYFFYVVSYDSAGYESPPSNVLYFSPPVISRLSLTRLANGTMQIKFRAGLGAICQLQYASSPKATQWQTLATALLPDLNGNISVTDPLTGRPPMRFYRAKQL